MRLALQTMDPDLAEALTSHLAKRLSEQSRLSGTVLSLQVGTLDSTSPCRQCTGVCLATFMQLATFTGSLPETCQIAAGLAHLHKRMKAQRL